MHKSPSSHRNALASETSPYLLQHADNPVNWYPWGPAALELARKSGKPILLSIGYSACHWCHVMAHESFEDEATAKLMNEHFVNIKVDREERPDIDKIYQLAHQVLARRGGGWPLTMFLMHDDQQPFFGGTYFPNEPRHGIPAFTDLLTRVAEVYAQRRDELRKQNASLMQVFADLAPPAATSTPTLSTKPFTEAQAVLTQQFDREYGGFGGAPKFPHPTTLEFLLRHWRSTAHLEQPDLQSLYMCTLTLTRMAEGGLYDQLGGGFCRYSVDQFWMIPHFEKMLYDNGPLLAISAQAAMATGEPLFKRIAAETADWMLREMQSVEGGFWSTLDADSEGHEGKFYVWQREQVQGLLDPAEFDVFSRRFGLDREPNFEGAWHLHVFRSVEEIAKELALSIDECTVMLAAARSTLLDNRNARIWPGRDEKVLTAWNGLAIRGLAIAARALDQQDLAAAATRAVDFVRLQLWRDGRLLAVYKDGQAKVPAYLDDYAFLLDALLELLQTRWRTHDLQFAIEIADALLAHFADPQGGFFFTADDAEQLIHRPKSFADEALPSGNGVAALALNRLGALLGEPRYLQAAEQTLHAAWSSLQQYPSGHTSSLIALEEILEPPELVIVRGSAPEVNEWQNALNKLYSPRRLVFGIASDAHDLPAALADKSALHETVAYVCRGTTCSEPLRSLPALIAVARG